MLKAPQLGHLQSKRERWRDARILAGGVTFFVGISAAVLVGFHNRDHSIRETARSVTTTGGATLQSSP